MKDPWMHWKFRRYVYISNGFDLTAGYSFTRNPPYKRKKWHNHNETNWHQKGYHDFIVGNPTERFIFYDHDEYRTGWWEAIVIREKD